MRAELRGTTRLEEVGAAHKPDGRMGKRVQRRRRPGHPALAPHNGHSCQSIDGLLKSGARSGNARLRRGEDEQVDAAVSSKKGLDWDCRVSR